MSNRRLASALALALVAVLIGGLWLLTRANSDPVPTVTPVSPASVSP